MPELPEVETIMQGLIPILKGEYLTEIAVNRADLRQPFPEHLARKLKNRRVIALRRRAKYIIVDFEHQYSLLLHLGMSGRIFIDYPPLSKTIRKHEHFSITTAGGIKASLVDPRRFGLVTLFETKQEKDFPLLASLGIEPLNRRLLTSEFLREKFSRKYSPIKNVLLDQRIIAGLGNIYVCEALFRARIHPERAASQLTCSEIEHLCRIIPEILQEAILAGGSTLRDYVRTDGQKGAFQTLHQVYGKEGKACPDCPGTPRCTGIKRLIQSGRSSFYCPHKQR